MEEDCATSLDSARVSFRLLGTGGPENVHKLCMDGFIIPNKLPDMNLVDLLIYLLHLCRCFEICSRFTKEKDILVKKTNWEQVK